jgi:hypothetical protein
MFLMNRCADTHNFLFTILKRLPTDYSDYGGEIERWADGDDYPDCSCGCIYFIPLDGELGFDWGVCGNVNGPRAGLLTFEHQAGRSCFEEKDYDPEGKFSSGPDDWIYYE